MALFLEDSQQVTKKQIPIPQNAKKVFKAMEKIYEPYLDKNIPGSKILKSLASDKQYNKKGNASKKNGEQKCDTVNVNDAKVRMHRQNKYAPNTIQYQLYGGELAHGILKKGIENARNVNSVEAVKPPKPTAQSDIKPSKVSTETIKTPKGTISYTVSENVNGAKKVINESNDGYHIYYDYLSDNDEFNVLYDFVSGKSPWGVRIDPNMYHKALTELSKFGDFTNSNFPTKLIYQWMGIIMRNTARLRTFTSLNGHSSDFDYYALTDFFSEQEDYPNAPLGSDDFYAWEEFLEGIGFYDWCITPDGRDGISDFGIFPLEQIILEYNEDLSPVKTLLLVNRCLDITHVRGDLSQIFIVGGKKSLNKIAEEAQRNKKIIISENQLHLLKEYHNQTVFNFDYNNDSDECKVSYEKQNWDNNSIQ